MIRRRRTRPQPGKLGTALLVGLGALALGAGCTKPGDGLILVKLTSSEPLDHVRVLVVHPATQAVLGRAEAHWPPTPPLQLGVYVPNAVSGPVDVIGCGFDGSGNLIASTPNDRESFIATAQSGAASAIVTVDLAPGSSPAHCMAGGAGGRGGAGGAGGSAGGSSGGTSSTGGTGGGAGTGGVGGTTGAGGTSGTGGAGGLAGTGGRGGTTGTAGGAGTGGRGGAAGAGGTGGSSGGRGGTAGTGGTGGSTGGTGGGAGMWRGAVALSTVIGDQWFPSVAVDAAGNAVVVYEQGTQVWANRYDRASGWGTPGPIDARAPVASKPSVAVDGNGNYLAVWGMQTGATLQGIWYSTSTNGTAWEAPASITTSVAFGPVLAMNANGAAIVAWTEQVQGSFNQAAAAARAAPGTPWQAQVMRPGEDNGSPEPAVAITGNGYGFVGWSQSDGLGNGWYSVWMRQFTVGVGWTPADTLEKYTAQNAYNVAIAANAVGDAIGTYIQISSANPPTVQLWARRFSATTMSWATAPLQVFDANSIDTYLPPSVTLDDAGNATVAFAVETSTGYQVQTSRTARTATMWPPAPTSMETDNVAKDDDPMSSYAYATMPIVRSDPAGNVTLVWRKRTAASGRRFDLVSRRYTAGNWAPQISAPAVALEDDTTNGVFWPTLAVGTGGTAVTTWYFAGSFAVWANVWR